MENEIGQGQTTGDIKVTMPIPDTLTTTNQYLLFAMYAGRTATPAIDDYIDYTNIKIEYGDISTPYSPYECGCINETICNKNMLKLKDGTYSSEGITAVVNDGKVTLNGTSTATSFVYLILEKKVKLPSSTQVTMSAFNESVIEGALRFNNEGSPQTTLNSKNSKTTFNTVNNAETVITYITIRTGSGITYNNFILYPQLEYGVGTDYEKNTEQTYSIPTQKPFRAIGEYKDTFIKQDGVWYEKHLIGEVVLDGTTNLFSAKSGTTNNNLFATAVISDMLVPATNDKTVGLLCNYFTDNNANRLYSNDLIGISPRTSKDFAIGFGLDSGINTIDLANSWLTSNNTTINYPLATPELIPCTTEQIIKLNEIQALAKTYKNTTHIFSEDEVSPEIEVTYLKDIATMLGGV